MGACIFECPTCQVFLGKDPHKAAILDRPLKDLIDKVILPEISAKEKEEERLFYDRQKIPMKPEYLGHHGSSPGSRKRRRPDFKLLHTKGQDGEEVRHTLSGQLLVRVY